MAADMTVRPDIRAMAGPVLREALEYLRDRKHWTTGVYDHEGCRCLAGAIGVAAQGHADLDESISPEADAALYMVCHVIGHPRNDPWGRLRVVTGFNDALYDDGPILDPHGRVVHALELAVEACG